RYESTRLHRGARNRPGLDDQRLFRFQQTINPRPRRIAMKKITTLLSPALVLGLTVGAPAQAQESLTVVSFGGAYGAAQKVHQIDPYMAKTGTQILFENYTGSVAEIKAQVEAGKIQWDVVDIETIDLERACAEGLLEVIPRDILLKGDDGTPAVVDIIHAALENVRISGEICRCHTLVVKHYP